MVIGLKPAGMFGGGLSAFMETRVGAGALSGIYEPNYDLGSKYSPLFSMRGPCFARHRFFGRGGGGGVLESVIPTVGLAPVSTSDFSMSQPDYMRVLGLMWQHAPLSYELKKSGDIIARAFLEIYEERVYEDDQLISNGKLSKLIQEYWYHLMCASENVSSHEDGLSTSQVVAYGFARMAESDDQICIGSECVSIKELARLTGLTPQALSVTLGLLQSNFESFLDDLADGNACKLHPFVWAQLNAFERYSKDGSEKYVASAVLYLREGKDIDHSNGHFKGKVLPKGFGVMFEEAVAEVSQVKAMFWKEDSFPESRQMSEARLRQCVRSILKGEFDFDSQFDSSDLDRMIGMAVVVLLNGDLPNRKRLLAPNRAGGPSRSLHNWVKGFVKTLFGDSSLETVYLGLARSEKRTNSSVPPPPVG